MPAAQRQLDAAPPPIQPIHRQSKQLRGDINNEKLYIIIYILNNKQHKC